MDERQRGEWVVTVEGACCKSCLARQISEEWFLSSTTGSRRHRQRVVPMRQRTLPQASLPRLA